MSSTSMPDRIRLTADPDLYVKAADLVAAYMWSNEERFWSEYEAAPKQIVQPLVATLFAAIHLLAEQFDMSPAEMLGTFLRSADAMRDFLRSNDL